MASMSMRYSSSTPMVGSLLFHDMVPHSSRMISKAVLLGSSLAAFSIILQQLLLLLSSL